MVTNEESTMRSIIAAAGRGVTPGDDAARARSSPWVTAIDAVRSKLTSSVHRFTRRRERTMMRLMRKTGESIGRFDVAATVVASALGLLLMYGNATDAKIDASYLGMPVFLLVTLPLLWRRADPMAALGLVAAGLVVHVALFGSLVRCGATFPVVGLLVFSAGARYERRDALRALGIGMVVIGGTSAADDLGIGVASVLIPLTLLAFGLGRVAHSRSGMVRELGHHNEQLRVARDERARLEVATDRARLSSELDALLQRRLADLARMADEGSAVSGDSTAATVALAEIEATSRQTLQEMRTLVGVLRDDDAPTEPLPTLTSLEALVLQAKGRDARLTIDGNPRVLPAGVELSAYRVVAHLLDGLDDAPGVEVGVRFDDNALEITVAGPAGRRGDAGAAATRARERVQLHRGTLETRTHAGRSEAVVHLPVAAGA
jgi:signal transduction histidine kinase